MTAKREHLQLPATDNAATRVPILALAELCSFLRTRIFEVYVLVVSLAIGAVIVTYLRWEKRPRQVRWFLRLWSSGFIYGARVILGMRIRVEGLENIPDRPVIFVGNHQTYLESVAMTSFFPHINVVTKRKAMAVPVFGWGLRYAPMIPIDVDMPGQNLRRLLREGRASIHGGRSILIYPEGSRIAPRETRPFFRGLGPLYSRCGCDVVPVVTDAGLCWPSGFKTKRPGVATMRFLPPIKAGQDSNKFAEDIERLLNTEKDRLLDEAR